MANKIEEDYLNVLSTHERILSLLTNESAELKKIPHRLAISERTPYFDAFERFSFEKGEITPLVQSTLNNKWDPKSFENVLLEKIKVATLEVQHYEDRLRDEKFALRRLVGEQDRSLRNAHHQNVPVSSVSSEKKDVHSEKGDDNVSSTNHSSSLNARTQWQKVTGNAPLPKHLRHLINNVDQVEQSPYFLSIPFKPAIWQDILKSEDVELFKQPTEEKLDDMKGVDDKQTPSHAGLLRYWNKMSFKEFVRAIPWFSSFSNRQITLLESKIRTEKFFDSQTIIRQGEPLSFCMIRQGEVAVTKKEAFNKPSERIKRLFSGDVFGYELTTLEEKKHVDSSLADFSFVAIGDVTIFSCSSQCIRQIMFDDLAQEGDDGQSDIVEADPYIQYAEMGLSLDHDVLKLLNEHCEQANNHYLAILKQLESFLELDDVPITMKVKLKSRILPLCASEIEFRDMADEFISRIRNLFSVDRFGIYIIDRISNMMHLYTSHINIDEIEGKIAGGLHGEGNNDKSGNGGGVNVFKSISGIRMPLKGIAANVAQNNRLLNIEDCYKSVHFDSAMDIRTGYRSQQMLCLPIQDSMGQAVGVLQFINPIPSRKFSLCDEELAKLVAAMVSPQVMEMQSKLINSHLPLPLHQFTSSVKLHLHRIESILDNRHIKYTVRFVLNGKDIIPSRASPSLFAMNPLPLNLNNKYKQMHAQKLSSDGSGASPWKCCDFNDYIDMLHLLWSDLQPGVMLIVEFFSKNNHPTGWSVFHLFNYKKVLQYGQGLELLLMAGGCPQDWNTACRMIAIHDLYQNYYKSGQQYHDHVVYPQLKDFFIGRILVDILMKVAVPSSATSKSVAVGASGGEAVIVFEDRYPFTFVSYEQGAGMKTSNCNNEGQSGTGVGEEPDEDDEQLDPSLSSFLYRFGLHDAKRQQFSKYIYQFNYSLPWQEGVNVEMRELMWSYRDEMLEEVPSSAITPLLAMLNYTDHQKISWALTMLCKYRRRLKVVSMIPLFDHTLSCCAKLQTFAVSAMYHYITKVTHGDHSSKDLTGHSNHNNRLRIPLLENILFFLLFILSGKEFRDSALYRLFLFLISQYPYSFGAMSFWYLRSFLQPDGRINITHSTAILMVKDVLKLLPKDLKVKLANGWAFLACLTDVYNEVLRETEGQRVPLIQFSHMMRDRLREDYTADTTTSQEISIDNQRSVNNHLIHEFCLPNHCDFHALEKSNKGTDVLKNKLASATSNGVSGENLARSKPDDSADFVAIKDISVGGHICKEGSFTVWCTTPTNFMGSFVFVPELKWRSEFFMAQMMRMMNSIFISEGLPNRETVVTSHYKGAIALNTLIVEAIQYHNKVVKPPTTFTIRRNDQSMNKIPDDLLINYFEKNIPFRKHRQDSDFIDDYLYSLGGYLLSSHVLGLHGVGPINTMVTCDGEIFVQCPSHILGVDVVSFYDRSNEKPKVEVKRQPIFFLPCMAEAIGGAKHPFFKDLLEIVKHGFLCLRREAAPLLWALKCLSSYLRFTSIMVETAFATLRETLMLDLSDVEAVRQLGDALNRGLNADYQLKLKR